MMKERTLAGWLLRIVSDPKRVAVASQVVLTYQDAEGNAEVLRQWAFPKGATRDELLEISRDVLADAQDHTDLQEARCSFRVAVCGDDGSTELAGQRVRCDPKEMSDDAASAEHAPNKEGVIAELMGQNARAFKALEGLPRRMSEIYVPLLALQQDRITALEKKNTELAALLHSLLQAAAGQDPEQQAAVEAQREAWSKAGADVVEIARPFMEKLLGEVVSKVTGAGEQEGNTVQ